MATCTPLPALSRFRHDPAPWQSQTIYFAGYQPCRFTTAEIFESLSGERKWLLLLEWPVWRRIKRFKGAAVEDVALTDRIVWHPTRTVWVDECLVEATFGMAESMELRAAPSLNGSVVSIHDYQFTHFRRADFRDGKAILDRHVWLWELFIDSDKPLPLEGNCWRMYSAGGRESLLISTQRLGLYRDVPIQACTGMAAFSDEIYKGPTAKFEREMRF